MSGTHAKFAPSKASVWGTCAGAIAFLEAANLPDEAPSIHTASGTLTHQIAEDILDDGMLGDDLCPGKKVTVEGFEFTIEEDRIERAMVYCRAVLARGGVQFYEQNMKTLPWPGTGDAIVARLEEHALEAHDLKDGNNIVYAQDNDQLICYLLLAWKEFDYLDDFQIFRGFIHQPKKGWTDEATYTRAEMEAHLERLTKAFRRGSDLIGQSPGKIKAALVPGGHCEKGWCRMRGQCEVRNAAMVDKVTAMPMAKAPAALADDYLGELLSKRAEVEAWFNDLFGEALNRVKMGGHVPGYKLATGKQGPRKWVNEASASDAMYEVLEHEAFDRTVISPTTAEKKLKKLHADVWAVLQSNIARSEGQVTLVPDTDPRAPLTLDVPEFENVRLTGADLL